MFLNSLSRAIAEGHLLAESNPGRSRAQQARLRGSAGPAKCLSWLVASQFYPDRKNCHLASCGGLLALLAVRGCEGDHFAGAEMISVASEQVLQWGEVEVGLGAGRGLAG